MRIQALHALALVALMGLFAPSASAYAASDDPCAPAEDGSVPEMCQGGVALPEMPGYPEMGGALFSATFTQLVTGDEVSRAVFNVEAGSISFADGSLSATVGCNSVFGTAELIVDATPGEPSLLTLSGPLASTKMYCDGLMEAEAALISILEGDGLALVADGISSANGLIRIDGGVPIAMPSQLAPEYPPFTIELDGSTYSVTGGYVVINGDRISASVGCNALGGEVSVDGDSITLKGPLMSTLMYCEGLMDAEAALSTVLQGGNLRWASQFELRSDKGAVLFTVLCGDCVAPSDGPSDPSGLATAIALLFTPVIAAAIALGRGLSRND